jgi:hypothetical protein
MAIISIDKAADSVAIKLGEQARVAPEKLMNFLADLPEASFSPSGILRVPIETAAPIETAILALNAIRQ